MNSIQFKTRNGHIGVEGETNGAEIKASDAANEATIAFS